ncbi:MAG: hypothetical protein NVS3B20_12740 [Polyangiales bacterium]
MVVHRKLAEFEPRASIRSWLYGICVRVAKAERRKAPARREVLTETPEAVGSVRGADALYEGRESLAMLDRALGELDPEKREVFVLYEIEELPMPEVARILGCAMQTAYSRHRVAREQVLSFFRRAPLLRGTVA